VIYERDENLPSAVSWIATAISLAGESTEAKKLDTHKTEVEARMTMDAENASRRPVIQESLDQANVVRPRVVPADHGKGAQQ
jgi:hypothetical protein